MIERKAGIFLPQQQGLDPANKPPPGQEISSLAREECRSMVA